LLRLWRERPEAPLRATLVPIGQPEAQRHFATLDALHAFLCTEPEGAHALDECHNTTDCTAPKVG
jgi:hypothetical protein